MSRTDPCQSVWKVSLCVSEYAAGFFVRYTIRRCALPSVFYCDRCTKTCQPNIRCQVPGTPFVVDFGFERRRA